MPIRNASQNSCKTRNEPGTNNGFFQYEEPQQLSCHEKCILRLQTVRYYKVSNKAEMQDWNKKDELAFYVASAVIR